MARLEVPIQTPVTFRRLRVTESEPLSDPFDVPPETVGIEFDGRLFVWHAFEPRDDPDIGYEERGPTVTVTVAGEDDEQRAADDLQRFLSALSFWLNQPIQSAARFGGSGETNPFHPPGHRSRRTHAGLMAVEAPKAIVMRPELNLRLAIAHYREGLSAGSAFYTFLAFWNALDAVFDINRDTGPRDEFINREALHLRSRWDSAAPFPTDPAATLQDASRNAIAHVIRDPGKQTVDPDLAGDRERIDAEGKLLRWIARRAIESTFPEPVSAVASTQ